VDLLKEAALLPLVGVFKDGNLTAVAMGVYSEEV